MSMCVRSVLCLGLLLATGCAITDYERICEASGDFSVTPIGICYIDPGVDVFVVWPDGCEQLVTFVEQDAFGNQNLLTRCYASISCTPFPVAGCGAPGFATLPPVVTAFNSCTAPNFDFVNPGAPCLRSLFTTFQQCTPLAECDAFAGGPCGTFTGFPGCPGGCNTCPTDAADSTDVETLLAAIIGLPVTTYRGEPAIEVPLAGLTVHSPSGVSGAPPVSGGLKLMVTGMPGNVRVYLEIGGRARQELDWLMQWVDSHGAEATLSLSVGSFEQRADVTFVPEGIRAALDSLSASS